MLEIPKFKFAIREDLQDVKEKFLPTRATPLATGWDVKAAFKNRGSIKINAGEYVKIPLGFRAFCPEGWWFELKPRSSSFTKKKLHLLYGTIDEDYEGEAILACQYIPDLSFENIVYSESKSNDYYSFKEEHDLNFVGATLENLEAQVLVVDFGEALGQIIPIKRQEMSVEDISNEEYEVLCRARDASRGSKGFGSTSK